MRGVYPKKMCHMLEIVRRRRAKNLEPRVENWYPTTCCGVKNWYRLKNIYLCLILHDEPFQQVRLISLQSCTLIHSILPEDLVHPLLAFNPLLVIFKSPG